MSFIRRLLNLRRSDALQRDIEREMSFHIDERVEELVASGTPRAMAKSIARRQFGNRTIKSEDTRAADVVTWADSILGDVRYALRALRRSPVFTFVAVASLALGIGFNTSIYTLIDAVVLRPLPVAHAEELVHVTTSDDDESGYFTNPLWEQVRDRQQALVTVAAFGETSFDLADGGEARFVDGQWVSGDYFRVFGLQPAAGRLLAPTDDRRGCAATVVLSHGFWQSEFGGRPGVIGKSINLRGVPFQIVGTLAEGSFAGPEVGRGTAVYVPICAAAVVRGNNLDSRSNWWLRVMGVRDPGMTLAEVRARLKSVATDAYASTIPERWAEARKAEYVKGTFSARSGTHGMSGLRTRYSKALLVLMGTVAILLLIACANVANLLLARAAAREREIAIRMAIGAGRRRLVGQLLTESAILAMLGAAAGLLVARWGSAALVSLIATPSSSVWLDLSFNWRILAFTAAATAVTVFIFGLIPAWRGTSVDPHSAMKANARGVVEGHTRHRFTLAKSLVVAQVAMSLVLLVGAGLLVGSLHNLRTVDAGFDPSGVLLVEANMQRIATPPGGLGELRHRVLERARALPGVRQASLADLTPIGGSAWNDQIVVDGFEPNGEMDDVVWFNEVSDGYFQTMDIRLLSGRDFGVMDVPSSPRVAVIDEMTARKFFDGASPIGKQFRTRRGDALNPPVTVVGVVESAKYRNLRETNSGTIYQASSQNDAAPAYANVQLRVDGDPLTIVPAVRHMLAEVHPQIIVSFSTLNRQVESSLARERLLALLSAVFGSVALALSMLGLYGVMAYAVARRRNEIGVRIALGADRGRVLRMVLGDVARVVAVGVALGSAGALASGKLVESFLFGIRPAEPAVLGLSALLLLVVAAAAGVLPAWRASRVDPAVALRED